MTWLFNPAIDPHQTSNMNHPFAPTINTPFLVSTIPNQQIPANTPVIYQSAPFSLLSKRPHSIELSNSIEKKVKMSSQQASQVIYYLPGHSQNLSSSAYGIAPPQNAINAGNIIMLDTRFLPAVAAQDNVSTSNPNNYSVWPKLAAGNNYLNPSQFSSPFNLNYSDIQRNTQYDPTLNACQNGPLNGSFQSSNLFNLPQTPEASRLINSNMVNNHNQILIGSNYNETAQPLRSYTLQVPQNMISFNNGGTSQIFLQQLPQQPILMLNQQSQEVAVLPVQVGNQISFNSTQQPLYTGPLHSFSLDQNKPNQTFFSLKNVPIHEPFTEQLINKDSLINLDRKYISPIPEDYSKTLFYEEQKTSFNVKNEDNDNSNESHLKNMRQKSEEGSLASTQSSLNEKPSKGIDGQTKTPERLTRKLQINNDGENKIKRKRKNVSACFTLNIKKLRKRRELKRKILEQSQYLNLPKEEPLDI